MEFERAAIFSVTAFTFLLFSVLVALMLKNKIASKFYLYVVTCKWDVSAHAFQQMIKLKFKKDFFNFVFIFIKAIIDLIVKLKQHTLSLMW